MDDDHVELMEWKQRNMRTPITYVGQTLRVVWEFWAEFIRRHEADNPNWDYGEFADADEYFAICILAKAWEDAETDGDKSVKIIGLSFDGTRDPDTAPLFMWRLMETIVAYSVQTMKAEMDGRHEEAWTYVADAQYWAGILNAAWTAKILAVNPAAEMAKRRHAENYALAADAVKYWRDKIDPSLSASKAANELLKFVPLSHKKLAELVAAEKKKTGK